MLRVRYLQVEVITSEHPIGLRRYQTSRIHTERTNHTFQLIHSPVLPCRLEGSHQRHDLLILHQDVEHIRIGLAEKRQHMRHVRELTRDGVRLHDVPFIILIPGLLDKDIVAVNVRIAEAVQLHEHAIAIRRYIPAGVFNKVKDDVPFPIDGLIVIPIPDDQLQLLVFPKDVTGQFPAVLEARRMEGHEEIDDGGQKVLSRVLEESLRTAFLVTALVQGLQQRGSRFRSSRKVRDIFPLDRVDTVGILYVRKVHDTEAAVLRQMAVFLVLAVLIEEVLSKCRELIVIDHHRKALRRMLTDERVDDAERLTRTRRTQHDRPTERVDDIDPALMHPLVEVIHHRDVHRILRLALFLRLLEGFVLEVEPVLPNLVVIVTCDSITALMDEHRTDDGHKGIEHPVGRQSIEDATPSTLLNDDTQDDERETRDDRVQHHRLQVELQALLGLCADTRHEDAYQFNDLTGQHTVEHMEPCYQGQNETRHTTVGGDRQVHDQLNNEENVYAAAEHSVNLKLLFSLFYRHGLSLKRACA